MATLPPLQIASIFEKAIMEHFEQALVTQGNPLGITTGDVTPEWEHRCQEWVVQGATLAMNWIDFNRNLSMIDRLKRS